MNRYVDFVSDEHFLRCIKPICDSYPKDLDKLNLSYLKRNTIDPFIMLFDLLNSNSGVMEWMKNEMLRQCDKKVGFNIGYFHQNLLGGVDGWTNLGIGHPTKLDLKRDDDMFFFEMKNKWNSMNSDAEDKCRDKLEKVISVYPNSIAYLAFICSRNGDSGEGIWVKKGRDSDERIRKIWGSKVYEIVTGDSEALNKTWDAIPIAVKDYNGSIVKFSSSDQQLIEELYISAIGKV
jgi:hypothetical protein